MSTSPRQFQHVTRSDTLHPSRERALRRYEAAVLLLAILATVVLHGLLHTSGTVQMELQLFVIFAATFLCVSLLLRYRWSLARQSFVQDHRGAVVLCGGWLAGVLAVMVFGPLLSELLPAEPNRFEAIGFLSQWLVLLRGAWDVVLLIRRATAGATDPAVVLVLSFAVLITVGTGLLSLPRSQAEPEKATDPADRFVTALFTATSATCVTGLVVVPTNAYWSPFGQNVILALFQIGGLGIMTCGAFFAVVAGRRMQVRESATLRDLLESEQLGDVRRLVLTILLFTFVSELTGAVLISGLFADLPAAEQVRYSVFHAVSAFCNAGFSLTENSFVGLGSRWQVWGGVAGLIIVGGLGFSVVYNLVLWLRSRVGTIDFRPLFHLPKERVRLALTTRLALVTTLLLLLLGSGVYYVLESAGQNAGQSSGERLSEAWFQAVTFRTAGFNTVDHQTLQPGTKLFAVLLMFIGASPGSTGGGVKTVCFAITALTLVSILRGRNRVEIAGRTIPPDIVNRSLVIIGLGLIMVMLTTMLLVVFEPDSEVRFLDYLFEATSAFGTVGVSAGVTPSLSLPSRLVIIVTMFVGRVGPLTLLIALAGRSRDARYEFPYERVVLG